VCEAVAISRDCPGLSLGLHWDVSGEGDCKVGRMSNPAAAREAFQRQLDAFATLTERMPTHIDSTIICIVAPIFYRSFENW